MGRLGNQLFQYSFAQWLHDRTGLPSRFDLSMVGRAGLTGPRVLQDAMWESRVRGSSLMPVPQGRLDPLARLLRIGRRPRDLTVDLSARGDVPVVRTTGSWYLGYWQRVEYAVAARDELRDMFALSNGQRDPVVRVHVRRGDYVALGQSADDTWFQRAVATALEAGGPDLVEVVSDDPGWCVGTLTLPVPFSVINGGSVLSDFESLARAEVLVATGSTFSWWAAFLGGPKIVHGPQVLPPALWSPMDALLVP
ncbi:MAG: alpha-1,2-fucosyltransferase [Candidatus Nanopelagicales bacterium]